MGTARNIEKAILTEMSQGKMSGEVQGTSASRIELESRLIPIVRRRPNMS